MANTTTPRLERLRATPDGAVRFASTGSHDGGNEFGDLEVTLTADQQVVGVRVHRVDGLRTDEQLQAALSEAIAVAELGRLDDSLRASGELDRYAAAEAVALTPRVPRVPPGPRGGRPLSRAELEMLAAGPSGSHRPAVGTSANGYLTLTLLGEGPGVMVQSDPEWLSAARPARLAAALREAFHDLTEELR